MDTPRSPLRPRMVLALMETFGLSLVAAFVVSAVLIAVAVAALVWVVLSAPPGQVTITSGPAGSTFERYAERYKDALAARGLRLRVLPSDGSLQNLLRLRDRKVNVEIGFVQGGLTEGAAPPDLVSLGSVAYQPLWLFYHNPDPIRRLAELSGKRIAIGPVGSGTHALALTLLQANGVSPATATLLNDDPSVAAAALQEGRIDALFLMGDSAPIQVLRTLIRAPGVRMYDWIQADAYVRRYAYLRKMTLPQGSIDLGRNLPAEDVALIGPTVELVAREGLNSAVSDLLLDVAQQVHGRPGLLQRAGEFPAPLGQDFTVSDDALRYYKSGKSFLYRFIPSYRIAGLINPLLVALVPVLLVLIPAFRFLPVLYRLRIHLRIYRCYRPLLRLERAVSGPLSRERAQELLQQLDRIEDLASHLKVPASFGYQFYELRGHILFVRKRLRAAMLR